MLYRPGRTEGSGPVFFVHPDACMRPLPLLLPAHGIEAGIRERLEGLDCVFTGEALLPDPSGGIRGPLTRHGRTQSEALFSENSPPL